MPIQTRPCSFAPAVLSFFLILSVNVVSSHGFSSRKLDESTGSDPSVKCTPCKQYSPPPPPPPPPSPKKPPSTYCPPPPPPPPYSFIYMLGPPGKLYPIDQEFGGAPKEMAVELSVVVLVGLMGFVAVWF